MHGLGEHLFDPGQRRFRRATRGRGRRGRAGRRHLAGRLCLLVGVERDECDFPFVEGLRLGGRGLRLGGRGPRLGGRLEEQGLWIGGELEEQVRDKSEQGAQLRDREEQEKALFERYGALEKMFGNAS